MNPTLNSPKYADPKSLAFQMYKKQQDRKQRINPYVPQLEQRYFRRNEGTTDYATIPEVTLAGDFVIEFDFLSAAVSVNQNIINFGDFLIRIQADTQINVWGSVDFSPAVFVVPELGAQIHNIRIFGNTNSTSITLYLDGVLIGTADGGSAPVFSGSWLLFQWVNTHFKGILANLKIYDNGTLIRDYPLDDNSDILRNRATVLGGNLNTTADPLDSVLIGGPAFSFYDFAELTSGVRYLATCDIANYSGSGAVGFRSTLGMGSGIGSRTRSSNGRVEILFDATDSGVAELFSQSSNQCTFSSISIRQADGYGTIINGNAADWGLFDKQADGDWLGQELVVNGGFDSDLSGWSIFGTDASNTVSYSNGFAEIISDGSLGWGLRTIGAGLQTGIDYKATTKYSFNTGAVRLQNTGGNVQGAESVSGVYIYDFIANGDSMTFTRNGSSPADCLIDYLSVKEVLKNA